MKIVNAVVRRSSRGHEENKSWTAVGRVVNKVVRLLFSENCTGLKKSSRIPSFLFWVVTFSGIDI